MKQSIRWLPIPGHEGLYEVSDRGDVRSLPRVVVRSNGRKYTHRGHTLKPAPVRDKHSTVVLCDGPVGGRQVRYVHRLVLLAFVGPPADGQVARHLNDVPDDNRIANLRWGTSSENAYDAIKNGLRPDINNTHCRRGHEFTAENIYIPADNRRRCRTCKRSRDGAYWHNREKAS